MNFKVRTPWGSDIVSTDDDNINVLIDFDDGRSFSAMFFTVQSLHRFMKSYAASGCAMILRFGQKTWKWLLPI